MKKNNYFVLAFIAFAIVFTNVSLSARKKTSTKRQASSVKTSSASNKRAATSTKRAAVSSTSTKRAATSGTARRAATSSTRTRRAATSSASIRRAARLRGATTAKTSNKETETANTNTCPIGVVIKKILDDEGNEVLYSSKETTCSEPENVIGTSDLGGLKLPTWIAGKNAYVLSCNSGFMKSTEDGVDVCVDQSTICPLNITVQKKDGEYYNSYTSEVCKLPASSSVLKLTADTNTDPSIPSDEAYYTYCNKNFYKNSDYECKACPSGKSTRGAYIKYENITDQDGHIIDKKSSLVEGATSEADCLTLEELKAVQSGS